MELKYAMDLQPQDLPNTESPEQASFKLRSLLSRGNLHEITGLDQVVTREFHSFNPSQLNAPQQERLLELTRRGQLFLVCNKPGETPFAPVVRANAGAAEPGEWQANPALNGNVKAKLNPVLERLKTLTSNGSLRNIGGGLVPTTHQLIPEKSTQDLFKSAGSALNKKSSASPEFLDPAFTEAVGSLLASIRMPTGIQEIGDALLDATKTKVIVEAGMFFDGTGNNANNTREYQRRYTECVDDYKKGEKSADQCSSELAYLDASYLNDLSNVAKLYDLYPDTTSNLATEKRYTFARYVDGIGTKSGEGDSGYGLGSGMGDYGVDARVMEGATKLADTIMELKISNIDLLTIDAFGFSRGAGAARHFVNEVLKGTSGYLGKALEERSISWPAKVEIRFVGLFDTVDAIVNLLQGDLTPHNDRNEPTNIYLDPSKIQHVAQLTARDERRYNFCLNSIRGEDHSLPSNFKEWVLPGVHSDIGGGYKSPESEAILLAPKREIRGFDIGWPANQSQAYRQLEKEKQKIEQEGWIGKFSDEGEIKIEEEQSGPPGEHRRYFVKLMLRRKVHGEYSRIPLHIMRELAIRENVPFSDPKDSDDNYTIPEELNQVKESLEQHVLFGKPLELQASTEEWLKQRYIHHSDNFEPMGPLEPHRPTDNRERTIFYNKIGNHS